MILRHLRGGALALLVTAIAVFAAPAPGMAAGDDFLDTCGFSSVSCQTGVEVAGPIGVCKMAAELGHYTIVCIDYDGDYVYVKDNQADSYSAMAYIYSQYGIADRYCRNTHGNGSWARCNFDWSESGTKRVSGLVRKTSHAWAGDYLWSFSNN